MDQSASLNPPSNVLSSEEITRLLAGPLATGKLAITPNLMEYTVIFDTTRTMCIHGATHSLTSALTSILTLYPASRTLPLTFVPPRVCRILDRVDEDSQATADIESTQTPDKSGYGSDDTDTNSDSKMSGRRH